MTHPMLTKAARAVGDCIRQERPLGVPATNADIARAVIQALRKPDEGMIEAGTKQVEECTDNWTAHAACSGEHAWAAMIDHLLNTKD